METTNKLPSTLTTIISNIASKEKQVISQQKLASQLPRGTRLDASGTRLEVKGSRNYSSQPLFIGANEMYEDIVVRGLRSDGLSSKLGVKNNRESISKLVSSLFRNDTRHDAVMSHFNSKRQRINSTKTVFATMSQDELKMIQNETMPSKVDSRTQILLSHLFAHQPQKLQNSIEVIKQLQEVILNLNSENDMLSIHNFQTRGFFFDMLSSMTQFIVKLLEDALSFDSNVEYRSVSYENCKANEETSAAEILLSVGSDVQPIPNDITTSRASKQTTHHPEKNVPEIRTAPLEDVKDGDKMWTTVEVLDDAGESKYYMIKSNKNQDTEKLLQLISGQDGLLLDNQVTSDSTTTESNSSAFGFPTNAQAVTRQEYELSMTANSQQLTFEVSLDNSTTDIQPQQKRLNEGKDISLLNVKRFKSSPRRVT